MDDFSDNHHGTEAAEEPSATPGPAWYTQPLAIAGLGLVLMVAACAAMPLRLEDGQAPLRVPGQIAFLFGLLVTLGGAIRWYQQAQAEDIDKPGGE
jgi:hypothetical protein